MTRIIIEFEVSRDQIQSVYNFSVHKGLMIMACQLSDIEQIYVHSL